jgi:hypothetical protein
MKIKQNVQIGEVYDLSHTKQIKTKFNSVRFYAEPRNIPCSEIENKISEILKRIK